MNRLVSISDVTYHTRLSEPTIRRYVKSGRIEAVRVGPKFLRFDLDAVCKSLNIPPPGAVTDAK